MGSKNVEAVEAPNQIFDTILCYDFGSQYDNVTTHLISISNAYVLDILI